MAGAREGLVLKFYKNKLEAYLLCNLSLVFYVEINRWLSKERSSWQDNLIHAYYSCFCELLVMIYTIVIFITNIAEKIKGLRNIIS